MTALARFSIGHPRWVLFLLGGVTLLLGAGLPRLETDVGYRAFLGARHPAVVELDTFVSRFGAGLPMAAVWSCAESNACESVFDEASLRMAHGVASALVWTVDYRYPVWILMDANVFVSVGNTFKDRLEGVHIKRMFFSWGFGLRTNASRDVSFDLLLAFGSNRLDSDSFTVDKVRFVFGINQGF